MADIAAAIFGGLGQGAGTVAEMMAKQRLLALQNKYGLEEYKKKKDIDLQADLDKTNRIRDAIRSRLNPTATAQPAEPQQPTLSEVIRPQKIGNTGLTSDMLKEASSVKFGNYDPETGTFSESGIMPNPRGVNADIIASPNALQNQNVLSQLRESAQIAQQYKQNPDNFSEAIQNQGLPLSKSERALEIAMKGGNNIQQLPARNGGNNIQRLPGSRERNNIQQLPVTLNPDQEYNNFIEQNLDLYAATGNIASIYDDARAHVNDLYSRRSSDATYQKTLREIEKENQILSATGGVPLEVAKYQNEQSEITANREAFRAVARERGVPESQIEALAKTKNPFQELGRLTGIDAREEGLGMRRQLLPYQIQSLQEGTQGKQIFNSIAPQLYGSQINRNNVQANLAQMPTYRETVNADGEVTRSVNSKDPNASVVPQKQKSALKDTLLKEIRDLKNTKYKAGR